jgi:hypothetical protein
MPTVLYYVPCLTSVSGFESHSPGDDSRLCHLDTDLPGGRSDCLSVSPAAGRSLHFLGDFACRECASGTSLVYKPNDPLTQCQHRFGLHVTNIPAGDIEDPTLGTGTNWSTLFCRRVLAEDEPNP